MAEADPSAVTKLQMEQDVPLKDTNKGNVAPKQQPPKLVEGPNGNVSPKKQQPPKVARRASFDAKKEQMTTPVKNLARRSTPSVSSNQKTVNVKNSKMLPSSLPKADPEKVSAFYIDLTNKFLAFQTNSAEC